MTQSDFIELLENKYYSLSSQIKGDDQLSKLKEIEIKQNLLYELLDEVKK